jgi:hypothetical protein
VRAARPLATTVSAALTDPPPASRTPQTRHSAVPEQTGGVLPHRVSLRAAICWPWPASPGSNRPDELRGIHLVVRRDVQGAGDRGAEQRLPGTCLADGQRFNVQAVGPLHVPQVHQGPAVGGIGTHRQGRRRQVTRRPRRR